MKAIDFIFKEVSALLGIGQTVTFAKPAVQASQTYVDVQLLIPVVTFLSQAFSNFNKRSAYSL